MPLSGFTPDEMEKLLNAAHERILRQSGEFAGEGQVFERFHAPGWMSV